MADNVTGIAGTEVIQVLPVQANSQPAATTKQVTLASMGAVTGYGTFVCNGTTNVTVSNTTITTTHVVAMSLAVVGGTVGALPVVTTITAGTSFTVAGTAGDTSTYNYKILV